MKANRKKKLIVSLIKDDLINSKLVYSLTDIGLDATCYHLLLSNTIFELMGVKENTRADRLFEFYSCLTRKVRDIDISQSHKPLDNLATEIFQQLKLVTQED